MVRTRGPPLRQLQPGGARIPRAFAGRYAEAHEHLDAVVRFLRDMGVREPCVIPVHADAIEARIGMGDLDGAADPARGVRGSGTGDRTPMGAGHEPRDAAGCCSRRAAMARPRRTCSSGLSRSIVESRRRSSSPARCSRRAVVERRAKQRAAGAPDPSAGARDLRGVRRAALGRQGSCRARPDRRPGAGRRRADADRATDRPARRGGHDEQGSRGDPRGGRADRRVRPDPDLSQARRPIAHGACPQTPRTSLSKVPGFPRYEGGSLGAMVVACRITWSSATGRDRIRTAWMQSPTGLLPAPDA